MVAEEASRRLIKGRPIPLAETQETFSSLTADPICF